MKKMRIFLGFIGILIAGAGAAAYMFTPTVHEGQAGEAPELGRFGDHKIGTAVLAFTMNGRSRISGWGAISGNVDVANRTLNVRFWYPTKGAGKGAAALRRQMDHAPSLVLSPALREVHRP